MSRNNIPPEKEPIILQMLLERYSDHDIATKLIVSLTTVKSRRFRYGGLLKKNGVPVRS